MFQRSRFVPPAPPRGGSPSDLSAWTNPRVPPIGPASLERPTGSTQCCGSGTLGGQDLAASMPVGRFDKLLAYNSIIWREWEFSEVTAYILHAVSNYVSIHVRAQHECEHVCMNEPARTHACAHACMCACVDACGCIDMHVYACICIYIYIYMHVYALI